MDEAQVNTEAREARREHGRFLWWVAGADQKILAQCPQADQIFVQHLGVSLSIAFLFVLFATSTAVLVAFPAVTVIGTAGALAMALLVACSVFLIDRLFIQADWDWQAKKQQHELATVEWQKAHGLTLVRPSFGRRIRDWFGRLMVVGGRLALAAAIGFTVASFLELVIYKDEINTQIYSLHYTENRDVYDRIDAREKQLDADIANARTERERLQEVAATLQGKLNAVLVAGGAAVPAQQAGTIAAQIADLRQKLAVLREDSAEQGRQMVCEQFGAALNPDCSGKSGKGERYATARALKAQTDAQIALYEADIAKLTTEQQSTQSREDQAAAEATAAYNAQVADLKRQTDAAIAARDAAQANYDRVNGGRDAEIAGYVTALKASPDFVPISFGMASQFRALAALYTNYGIQLEKFMVKALIMLIELTPILQKLFLSPKTLYALKLDSDRKRKAYDHLKEVLASRWEASDTEEGAPAARMLEPVAVRTPEPLLKPLESVAKPVTIIRRDIVRDVTASHGG